MRIFLNSPANGVTISGFASQGGVTITASGSVLADRYTVNSVEVSFGSSTVTLPARSGSWTCTSNKITAGGSLTINARVTGKNTKTNISDTQTDSTRVTVVMTDDIPPAVTIAGVTVAEEPNGKYTAVLKGTAADNMSGIKKKDILVAVSPQYPPKDPTVQEYFSNLMDFIVRRVKVAAQNRPLQVEDLAAEFCQPFRRLLSVDGTLSTEQVHQIRICIEVLRQYLAKHGPLSTMVQKALQQAETEYRQAAYETLLKRIGTSFEELRAARFADESVRQALAQRLGIDLMPPADDSDAPQSSLFSAAIRAASGPILPPTLQPVHALEQLLLQPGQFTEADLETFFGLMDTTRDPLQTRTVNPTLLDWQMRFLTASWAKQDAAATVPSIDPDLICEGDVIPGTMASFLWQSRYNWVKGQLAALKKVRELQGSNLLNGFDAVVKGILGLSANLLALEAQRVAGVDIEPQLAQMQLTVPAFIHLMRLRKLAAAGTILSSEWNDVYSILAQVEKLRMYPTWRAEEQASTMVLRPDSCRITEPGESGVPPAVSPEWRMTVQARQTWQDTLKARINQQQALKRALRSVVDATEEDTLPLLRDALVSAIGNLQLLPDAADALTQKLLIDVTSSGFQTITRIAQAIQTLQAILIALRTGRLEVAWEQDTAQEPQADFDEELEWMGSYGTWHAAMQVYLFPENFLLPTLRPVPDVLPSVPEKVE